MAPTLILIRHAQALHNVDKDYSIPDPPLSKLGHEQCALLRGALKMHPLSEKIELIVVSPMVRTLQTAMEALDWLVEKGVKVELSADWQENSDKPCDTGSDLSIVEKQFEQYKLDFSAVDPTYPDKTSPGNPYAFSLTAVLGRGQRALRDLYNRPEKVIAVVSHSGFLRTAVAKRDFANADYRIYEYAPRAEKDGPEQLFVMEESEETFTKGGGLGKSNNTRAAIGPDEFPAEV